MLGIGKGKTRAPDPSIPKGVTRPPILTAPAETPPPVSAAARCCCRCCAACDERGADR